MSNEESCCCSNVTCEILLVGRRQLLCSVFCGRKTRKLRHHSVLCCASSRQVKLKVLYRIQKRATLRSRKRRKMMMMKIEKQA